MSIKTYLIFIKKYIFLIDFYFGLNKSKIVLLRIYENTHEDWELE